MRRIIILLVLSLIFLFGSSLAFADLSVGVKSGDWIEYGINYTGVPFQGHDVTSARMTVVEVQGTNISVSIISRYANGYNETTNSTLNLQTGHLIDDFIIPDDLKVGDMFRDQNLGNVTISTVEQRTYAGALRTVVSASASNNTYFWDRSTGVSVEGTSQGADYNIHTIVSTTNMWLPAQRVDLASLFLVGAVLLVILVAAIAVVARYLRRRACKNPSRVP
jgi:membrane protein YdbS with pleckstrin-like domain